MNHTHINWREVHAWTWLVLAGALFGACIYFGLGGR